MPRKLVPGRFTKFNGMWARGSRDNVPPDHFETCLNNIFQGDGVQKREGTSFSTGISCLRMQLYKPLPPFSGGNIPRIIALKSNGDLIDVGLSQVIGSGLATDFSLVNFFGRAYINLSNGKTGLSGVNLKVYNGSGTGGMRDAGGAAPTTAIAGTAAVGGTIDVGTYLISYAFETASGFITKPCAPFVGFDSFGSYKYTLTSLSAGPTGTVARWIIVTKAFPLASIGPLGGPYNVGLAEFTPTFFYIRVGDNTTTSGTVVSFFDEQLVDSADYLWTNLATIPAGVGLIDYNSRLVTFGEDASPSLVRVSLAGSPENFSSTSGFLQTDPSDSTGVRAATEFRKTLYFFKRERGYVTQDNGQQASTWEVTNFEKSIGTEQYGVSAVMDAKGSSSEGFFLAALGGLYFFDGVFEEPEISYKIKDLWNRINKVYFHTVQVAVDPIQKRIYVVVPLDGATTPNYILFCDYRNGLNANSVKWSIWQLSNGNTTFSCILIFTDFTGGNPVNFTILGSATNLMVHLDPTALQDYPSINITSYFQFTNIRFTDGISQFGSVKIRALGPCTFIITPYNQDGTASVPAQNIVIPSLYNSREFVSLFNLVSEACILRVTVNSATDYYDVTKIIVDGSPIWDDRPI